MQFGESLDSIPPKVLRAQIAGTPSYHQRTFVYVSIRVGVTTPVTLERVELHSLGLGVSISPLVALVSIELHS